MDYLERLTYEGLLAMEDERGALRYELRLALRDAYVEQYQGRELFFALSLASGRLEDCVSDVHRRHHLTLEDARRLLDDADRFGLYTLRCRQMLGIA